ncbi:MAG TPA: GAF domain-containing protein, partial [Bradyrhizobium sp.]|nr:GAF domain-containing protein [Bradyrhizobium sp.]
MAMLPEDMSVAIDELESAIAEMESRLESARAERDESKARQIELEIENANLRRELSLTRERHGASAEILRSIADFSDDSDRLLQLIAETTARLFGAPSVRIALVDGEKWGKTIDYGASAERVRDRVAAERPRFGGDNLPGAVLRDNRQIHIPDLDNIDPAMAHWPVVAARAEGTRTVAATPLRRENKPIGVLIVYRDRLAPFTDDELALQQSFADQAVIAIENARLIRETQDTLERQTATADILKVIASSPSDVQPVFEAIADSAKRLLGGFSATVLHFIGDELHLVAFTPTNPGADEGLRSSFPRRVSELPIFELVRDGATIQFPDTEAEDVPATNRDLGRLRGFRSVLFVPLMNRGKAVGILSVTRTHPGAFAEHHVQLLQTFAAQAVIAIENARLFNETQEALERQTATADILKVIASSPSDVQPVFDAIASNANRLVGGFSTAVHRVTDDIDYLVAFTPTNPESDAILKAAFPRPRSEAPAIALVTNGETAQVADCEMADERIRRLGRARGWRSVTFTPLINQGTFIGFIACTRRETGVLADHHVQLLRTFADQAVIAIENTRLFNEVRQRTEDLSEALQQQTATGEVLKVIASSPTDVKPALQAIVESACVFCNAYDAGVLLRVGDDLHFSAHHGPIQTGREPRPISRDWVVGRSVVDRLPVQVSDFEAPEAAEFPEGQRQSREQGHRCTLSVPLLREGEAIGAIALRRLEPMAFSDKQVALLRTFADQAVIAIENTRLFNETKEALERQTATAEILKVIASSPSDVQPVFDAIVHSANRLIGGYSTAAFRYGDGKIHLAAFTPTDEAGDTVLQSSFPVPLGEFPPYHLTREGAPAELPDTEAEPAARDIARARGYR